MLKYQYTIILSLFLFSYNLTAQPCCAKDFRRTIKDTARTLKTLEQTDNYFQSLIQQIKSNAQCPTDSLTYAYWRYGVALKKQNVIRQAIQQFDTVINIKRYSNIHSTYLDMPAHQQMGECYEKILRFDEAIEHIKHAIDINSKLENKSSLAYRYRRLGGLYTLIGDYEKGIKHLHKSIELYTYYKGEQNRKTGIAWDRLGVTLMMNDNFNEAINASKQAISIAVKNNNTNRIISAINNIGNIYERKKDYQQATEAYRKIDELCIQNPEVSRQYCIKAQNNLGVSLMKLGQVQEAQTLFNETLAAKQNQQDNTPHHYSYSATLENLGDLELAKNKHNISLNYYQKALMNLSDNFRNTDIFNNPTPEKNEFIYSKIDLIRILDLKAKAVLAFFEKNNDQQYLQLSLDTYKSVNEWINLFYRDISTEKSKLEWIARTHEIYANAIHVALEAGQPECAFHFAERARAVLLWQSLSEQAARTMLTPQDREAEDSINIEIRFQETAYFDADPHEKDSLQLLIQDLNRAKERLVTSFEKKYPDYHNRKYNTDFITLKEVQNNIIGDSKTALLEYFSTEKLLYIFIINKNEIITKKINIQPDFYANIDRFNELIKNENSSLGEFVPPAYGLYQSVLAPALQHVNDQTEKLILIPDGRLNYVTFEALLTDTTAMQNWQTPNYLIDDYTVNYMYSCNSAHTAQEMKRSEKDPYFLGVAPTFGAKYGTPQLAPLHDTDDEVQAIRSLYKGSVLLGSDATNQQLIDRAKGADIIHIASHATQGEGEGKIYLYGGDVMTQKDIQALSWSAQQVILSACETGTSELSKGEGVLSLGWSFAYKGVPSIVMSQWAVSSRSTTKLMERYHKKLREQLPADQALRQAKLEFRDSANAMMKAHPYHWAAFTHTGNTSQPKGNQYTWVMLTLGLLATLLYAKNRFIG